MWQYIVFYCILIHDNFGPLIEVLNLFIYNVHKYTDMLYLGLSFFSCIGFFVFYSCFSFHTSFFVNYIYIYLVFHFNDHIGFPAISLYYVFNCSSEDYSIYLILISANLELISNHITSNMEIFNNISQPIL